jgi:callose synthase
VFYFSFLIHIRTALKNYHLFVTAISDIAFTWKARYTMEHSQKVKLLVKLALAIIWNIILPVCYANSRRKYCYYANYGSLNQEWCFTSYMVAAAIYLTSNAAEVVLFFVPAMGKYIEVSNNKICKVLAWWIQVSSS